MKGPAVVYVPRDLEGLRLVLQQMLERNFDLLRLEKQAKDKPPEVAAMMLRSAAQVTYSPGYRIWAEHLRDLEARRELGLPAGELTRDEVEGLVVLDRARAEHTHRHPNCAGCGMPQHNRFQLECVDCGMIFRRRGK